MEGRVVELPAGADSDRDSGALAIDPDRALHDVEVARSEWLERLGERIAHLELLTLIVAHRAAVRLKADRLMTEIDPAKDVVDLALGEIVHEPLHGLLVGYDDRVGSEGEAPDHEGGEEGVDSEARSHCSCPRNHRAARIQS